MNASYTLNHNEHSLSLMRRADNNLSAKVITTTALCTEMQ